MFARAEDKAIGRFVLVAYEFRRLRTKERLLEAGRDDIRTIIIILIITIIVIDQRNRSLAPSAEQNDASGFRAVELNVEARAGALSAGRSLWKTTSV